MDKLDIDVDESPLFCKTLIKKRKAIESIDPNYIKQLKITFSEPDLKTNQLKKEMQKELVVNKNLPDKQSKNEKSYDWDSKFNESTSSYFCSKRSKSTCPLCLKSFNSDSTYSAHMKQCAKAHKMSTQQLLKALELQKKQMQERRDLGLCSQSVLSSKKPKVKKKSKIDQETYDLALGLALSKSLTGSQEIPKATLEEFGFTTSSNLTEPSGRRKNYCDKKSVLRERTLEERQRIIVEKVAVVLLDETVEKTSESEKLHCNTSFLSSELPQLWNLGENGDKRDWYVSSIKKLILLGEERIEAEVKPTEAEVKSTETEVKPTEAEVKPTEAEVKPTETEVEPAFSDNIESEIFKLNLPQKEVFKGWQKMINNNFKSDITVKTKDFQTVHLHSLVLFVRWPEIPEQNFASAFEKYNLSTVLIFLEYLYCGTLNTLIRSEIINLLNLAAELNIEELVATLNRLMNDLEENYKLISSSSLKLRNSGNEPDSPEVTVIEGDKSNAFEDKDLFAEEDIVNVTPNSQSSVKNKENSLENESNAEKSFWSFIHHEKKNANSKEGKISEENKENSIFSTGTKHQNESSEVNKSLTAAEKDKVINMFSQKCSDSSETKDTDTVENENEVDCIVLSSGSESKAVDHLTSSPVDHSKPPSPADLEYEIPYFDPYDNFHCFAEEQFSPVGLHSQSLLTGDISAESLKLPDPGMANIEQVDEFNPEKQKSLGYCSTPVTARHVLKEVRSSTDKSLKIGRERKLSHLSSSRILRKSLNLHQAKRKSKLISFKKKNAKKKKNELVEVLANSILSELSKSSVLQSSFSKNEKFVEITPIPSKEEFGESVTPSPNYSKMGETLIKEQLTKYGLKKNLAKSKAKKILRHIYEELHPLYNTETGKIVKLLSKNSPKANKKSKTKKDCAQNVKSKQKKNKVSKDNKLAKKDLNSSNQSNEMSSESTLGIESPNKINSSISEFEDLNETLTQSIPSSPVDLPSAFSEFLANDPEYHQKILLYEPIWLEDLQKKLKETFKKRFKLSDLMDYLDKMCITFRSLAQAKSLQRRYKKKENSKKNKHSS